MALKGRKKDLSAELTPHPDDLRIAETTSRKRFKETALISEFQAAVLYRYSDAYRSKLGLAFAEIYFAEQNPIVLNTLVACFVDATTGDITLNNFPQEFEPVRDELVSMVRAFHEMTGETRIQLSTLTDIDFDKHDHPYKVLNCSWVRSGTAWETEAGKTLNVGQGNWFFFKEQFKHWTPENVQHGIVVIVKPLDL